MNGPQASASPFLGLVVLGAAVAAVTLATPFAFWAGGDNAYMALALATGLLAAAATGVAERVPTPKAFWFIVSVALMLRVVLLFLDPLLSTDIYRYVWDGRVQAAGVNPYRYVPADEALAALRDAAIYPNINRAGSAVTIYPPMAQMFFFLVTRLGESVTTMKLGMLACEAVTASVIVLLLRRIGRPSTRLVAYAWHPLPMWEIANNGHVDALMLALMMVGIWLALMGRPLRGGASVAFGALAKPFALLALPALWRPWDPKLPAMVLGVFALCYAPYLSVGTGVFGYLTTGYLSEERFDTGGHVWPLAMLRRIAGAGEGGMAGYLLASALLTAGAALWVAFRRSESSQAKLRSINMLLLLSLFLLSPNYPWYSLIATPFVALVGGAPVWMLTIGAVLLQEEAQWDPHVPILVRKSVLYGAFLIACAYAAWRPALDLWRRRAVRNERERRGGERAARPDRPAPLP